MRYLYQIANTVIIIILLAVIKILTRLELTSFQLFFIIPLGTFVIGLGSGFGYPKGMIRENIKSSYKSVAVVFFFATLTFIGIYFAYYLVTFVDDQEKVNFLFRGVHISKYKFEAMEKAFNFISFTIDEIKHSSFSPTKYYIRKYTGTIESGAVFSWTVFAGQYAGFLFGAYGMHKIIIGGETYCDECKKYMLRTRLFRFDENIDKQLNSLFYFMNNGKRDDLNALINENPYKKKSVQKLIVKGTFYCCDSHDKGRLRLEYYNRTHRGYRVDNKQTINYRLKPLHIMMLKKIKGQYKSFFDV